MSKEWPSLPIYIAGRITSGILSSAFRSIIYGVSCFPESASVDVIKLIEGIVTARDRLYLILLLDWLFMFLKKQIKDAAQACRLEGYFAKRSRV